MEKLQNITQPATNRITDALRLLNETSVILDSNIHKEDFYAAVSKKLKEMSGGSSVTLSEYDAVKKCIFVRHAETDPGLTKEVLQVLGSKKIIGTGFPVTPENYQMISAQPIRYIYSLNEATFGTIPKLVSKLLQKMQGIDRFLTLSYFIENELYGISLVALRENVPDPPPDIIQFFSHMVSVALRRKRAEEIAETARKESGRLIEIADNSRRVLLSVVEDVKKAHEELSRLNAELEDRVSRRTQQLEMANRELESFSYSVSHDLRAPLRAMDSFSRILMEEHAEGLDPEAVRILNIITDNARRMGTLIDNLLAFSRLSRQELTFSQISMKQTVEDVLKELRSQLSLEKVVFKIHDLPDAYGDPSMIKHVYLNLIGNAVKFSAYVPHPLIEIGCNSTDNENTYYIKDNGAGFDMKYVKKLFGVFQRLHSTNEFEGTGVGLAIVHRIITRMNGQVKAKGKIDEGAVFYFSLPKRPAETSVNKIISEHG